MRAKYRHEMKYIIPSYLYQEMSQVFRHMMEHDSHAGEDHQYNIRSLYFDDMYRTAYNEKLDGIQHRKKYRIRIYDCQDRVIALECKHKDGPYIYKESVKLSLGEYEQILNGDIAFLLKRKEPMAGEFFIDARTNLIRPEVIVEYDREPFVNDVGTVRITFDKNLRAMAANENMFDPQAPSFGVMTNEEMILEVKFTGILPEKIRRLFRTYDIIQTSASKFCMCADKIADRTGKVH